MDNGEWMSTLARDGSVCSSAVKGSLWKGCFKVPRALLMLEQLLEEEVKAHHESY